MKKNLIIHFILVLLLKIGVTGCTEETISMNADRMPDETAMDNIAGALRNTTTLTNKAFLELTEGDESATEEIFYSLSQSAGSRLTVTAVVNEKLVEDYNEENNSKLNTLPAGNVQFENGGVLSIDAGEQKSAKIKFTISTAGLNTDTPYLLPLTMEEIPAGVKVDTKKQVLYYIVNIRKRITTCYPNNQYEQIDMPPMLPDAFVVFYVNTSTYQPLIADVYGIQKINQIDYTQALHNIGSIVNLRIVTMDYESATGRALLNLSSDIRDVLEKADKFIRPLQEHGRKVCLSIENGNKGFGFCNLNDMQLADFVQQVKNVVELYRLDGINLWDKVSTYNKEGMFAMNTVSYPKLIKALRDALPEKLLTVVDKGEATEYFYDVNRCGGIEVGRYIDYAWHAYDSGKEVVQIIEPWDAEHPYSEYTRKPIIGLAPECYGSLVIPLYEKGENPLRDKSQYRMVDWKMNKRKKNNIVVYAFDLTANEQNMYEGMVNDIAIGDGINAMMDDGAYWGQSIYPPYDWGFISGEYSYTYKPLDWLLRQMYNVYSKGWVRPSGM